MKDIFFFNIRMYQKILIIWMMSSSIVHMSFLISDGAHDIVSEKSNFLLDMLSGYIRVEKFAEEIFSLHSFFKKNI